MKKKIKLGNIVAGCKANNPLNQRQLYDNFCGMVMGVALRYTQNQNDAEDLVQDVFIKVFTRINSLRDEKLLPSWIKTVATNTALDFLRAKKQQIVPLDETCNEIQDVSCEKYDGIPAQKLLQFVQELPTGYRTVFNLCAIDGYPYEEVAQMLGCTNSTVRSQLFKAKKALKEKILNYE